MKILILNNFFNYYSQHIPEYKSKANIFSKFYKTYNEIKLKTLLVKLRRKFEEKTEFKIITSSYYRFNINNIPIELLNDFRLKIERKEFIKMSQAVVRKTKMNLAQHFKNLKNLKIFHFNGIFIGKLVEYELIVFLNRIFGELELLKKIIKTEQFDKIIIFNFNPNFIDFIKELCFKHKKIQLYSDTLLKRINKSLYWYIYYFLFLIFKESVRGIYAKKPNLKKKSIDKNIKNIILFGAKKKPSLHFKTVKPIYESLKKYNYLNPIYYYKLYTFLPIRQFYALIRVLFQVRKILRRNFDKICLNMEYDSIKIDAVIKEFYRNEGIFNVIVCFIFLNHFNEFIKYYPPKLVINTTLPGSNLYALYKNCKMKNIPTMYIPHGTAPIFDEINSRTEATYLIVTGNIEKKFLIRRGELPEKIYVFGKSSHESFYNHKIKQLKEVKDMFSDRKHKFQPNKPTILLTTSQIEDESNKRLITLVINSLKELNLLDNLIIKLHPQQDGLLHKKLFKELNVNPIIVKSYDILEILNSCTLILSPGSTVILEAVMMGKPIIFINVANLNFVNPIFLLEEPLLTVTDQESLIKILREFIDNRDALNNYSEKLKEQGKLVSFYDKNESATEKIVNFILKIIEN